MNAVEAAVFAQKAAYLNLGYTIAALFIIFGVFTFLGMLGEKTLGLSLKGFVNNVEAEAGKGNVWPGVVCFVLTPCGLLALILWIGLR